MNQLFGLQHRRTVLSLRVWRCNDFHCVRRAKPSLFESVAVQSTYGSGFTVND